MNERLLTVDEVPRDGWSRSHLWIGGERATSRGLYRSCTAAISAELDRLYAADEANQAPGPDWKAKLREEVEAQRCGWYSGGDAIEWVLTVIDALPDPPTSDPDAPPVYVPPEGRYIVLGEDVRDGWEGRRFLAPDEWGTARWCRQHPDTLFEVRRVPAPEPATEWVPLHKIIGRRLPSGHGPIGGYNVGLYGSNVNIGPDTYRLAMDAEGRVEVLAEGER